MDIVRASEGLELHSYLCPAKVWTIGIGTTKYPSGARVQPKETCTEAQAYEFLAHDLAGAAKDVDDLTVDTINQNQFDALTSFVYNLGRGNFQKSTLLKLINANPNDPNIRAEFAKWNKGGGEVLKGLVIRRDKEADLYFSK